MNKDGQKGGEKECHSCDANKNTHKKKKKKDSPNIDQEWCGEL